jgi:uncharacterized protein YxjI
MTGDPTLQSEAPMLLDRQTFLVKEHAGLLKLSDTYDIFDPDTGEKLGVAREEVPAWAKLLRLVINKKLLPTSVAIREGDEVDGPVVLTIRRGVGLFRVPVEVILNGRKVGTFKSKVFSLGGGFMVYDADGAQVADVSGDWKGWDLKFTAMDGRSLGRVAKKWAGLAKELFTSADNYMISIHEGSEAVSALLLAAGLAIDTVFKETG